jgi:hypothetical protein
VDLLGEKLRWVRENHVSGNGSESSPVVLDCRRPSIFLHACIAVVGLGCGLDPRLLLLTCSCGKLV